MTTSMTSISFTPLLFAGLLALLFLLFLAGAMALVATRHRTHGIPGQFGRLSGLCALFALGAEQAAIACKRALGATLYWGAVSDAPTSPTLPPSPVIDVMEEGADAFKSVMRIPPGAPRTEMLDSGPSDQLGPRVQAHIPWPGVMILSRLLYLALAVCILGPSWSGGPLSSISVVGAPGGRRITGLDACAPSSMTSMRGDGDKVGEVGAYDTAPQ